MKKVVVINNCEGLPNVVVDCLLKHDTKMSGCFKPYFVGGFVFELVSQELKKNLFGHY